MGAGRGVGGAPRRDARPRPNFKLARTSGTSTAAPGKIAFDKEFGDPISAAEQSAKFLKKASGAIEPAPASARF